MNSFIAVALMMGVSYGGGYSSYRSELRVVSPQPVQQVVVQEYAPVQRVIVQDNPVVNVPNHCYVQPLQQQVQYQQQIVQRVVQQPVVVKQRLIQAQRVQVQRQNVYSQQRGGLFGRLFNRNRGGY